MEYINLLYIFSTVLLIIGLRKLSSPSSAAKGNIIAAVGMGLATVVAMFEPIEGDQGNYVLILLSLLIGTVVGLVFSKKVAMTAVPELVSLFNGFGGACAVAISIIEVMKFDEAVSMGARATTYLAMFIGGVAFTGSLIAYGKLSGKVKDWKSGISSYFNLIWLALCLGLMIYEVMFMGQVTYLPMLILVVSLIYGFTFVLPIGGADMPVVISLLNAFTGIAAALAGIVYGNMVMLLGGILVGSSGTILTVLMCNAMNRSLINVIIGGFGGSSASSAAGPQGDVKEATANDTAIMMRYASNVMIIPGYGMAVAQAQKACKELDKSLTERGVNVNYAIHPVAGRMPGHMNVLLAEADVPYNKLIDLDDANAMLSDTDVCLVVGANDVVNPSALDDPGSPIYGMPVLEILKSKNVIVLKRSMNKGYSGIENPLFFHERTKMLFGDAKATIETLNSEVKSMD
ncbi:NAD(P)(+) transhydrogenase (Re/Si-specific) subunit beta [Reichenbachiella agarivorans]|uniref:NAD(P) transhydrogenase subunit beta n=1 Tax=Reichenbachiella agarivorans TaxID=2979464 RepID=A0ABY6CJL8_9BACT|nr:NAD(P)(+) transhydrogenase (Re/Si-specific) subunit beta [Reichenbachiella agarivorans]UXP30708.1 NAD(P)(+) transhydrogenase (Re/Si-specific) subunit beta [Reichenbachiella agarivorans]